MHLTSVTIVASLASFSFSQPSPTLQVPMPKENVGGYLQRGFLHIQDSKMKESSQDHIAHVKELAPYNHLSASLEMIIQEFY